MASSFQPDTVSIIIVVLEPIGVCILVKPRLVELDAVLAVVHAEDRGSLKLERPLPLTFWDRAVEANLVLNDPDFLKLVDEDLGNRPVYPRRIVIWYVASASRPESRCLLLLDLLHRPTSGTARV